MPYRDDREILRGQVEQLEDEIALGREARERVQRLERELAAAREEIERIELERVQASITARSKTLAPGVARAVVAAGAVLFVASLLTFLGAHRARRASAMEVDLSGYEPGCGPASTAWPSPGGPDCHRLKCSVEALEEKHAGVMCEECPVEAGQRVCAKHYPAGWTHRCDHVGYREASYEIWCRPKPAP